ncbi:unnamed protein product [Dracunculus medinensis]|uniref:B box-type domain-containing protein n=1 Tax=Dracunculus medinensis TaxID=318479 RepID=A0A158Q4J6_DRAME|nr:unnamed protein product [Dracunculus medinensis]
MEEELKCPHCKEFATGDHHPVLLSCAHSYCRQCAVQSQQPACHGVPSGSSATLPPTVYSHLQRVTPLSPPCSSSGASDTISVCISDQDQESDKLSVVSEADSGVVICGRNSRPSSLIGSALSQQTHLHRLPSILTPSTSECTITCKACQKPTYLPDEQTILNMQKNVALCNLINRYRSSQISAAKDKTASETINCQLCDTDKPAVASVFCEQCDIFYCQLCQSTLHPSRGPLATHKLVHPSAKKLSTPSLVLVKESKCTNHPTEVLTMYCVICRTAICCICLQEIRHSNHDVQSIEKMCKCQKVG